MTSGEFIKRRLGAWAVRKRIPLQGPKGKDGAKSYTFSPEDNLFEGSLSDAVRSAFSKGAGAELLGEVPKIAALHSSSALGVNLFAYWLNKGDLVSLARLLEIPSEGIKSACFEDCFPIIGGWKVSELSAPPLMDLAFRYDNGARVGVECKLFEPYRPQGHARLSPKYLTLARAWKDIPRCLALARLSATGSSGFDRLGVSQILRHILGLKYGATDGSHRLIYLYYDAPGMEGAEHRGELDRFKETIKGDPVHFVSLSVQEFILRLCERARSEHTAYVDYLAERYL